MPQHHIGLSPTPRRRSKNALRPDGDTGQLPSATNDWIVAPQRLLALFEAKDVDALIGAAFRALHATVACDFASAFYRTAGNALLKERDSQGREYEPEFMRRYEELTPAIPLVMANRGIKILLTRTALPSSDEELHKTAFYREIMQLQGWRHGVSLCFWGDPPAEFPVFVTAVYRRPGQNDFSDEEVESLGRIYSFLDCAVSRVHEREGAETLRDGMAMAVRDGTLGFAILDRNLLLVQANPIARQLCAAWMEDVGATHTETSSLTWHLPPALLEGCRELHHEWQSLLHADPDTTGLRRYRRVVHARVPGLTASITMVCPSTTGIAEPTFVLEFDRRVHGVTLETPDRSVPLLQKMTAAERAVAMVLADGFSNQEIADRLGKTVDAVKFLLHRIYQKTGIPSRAALVAVLRARPNRSRKSQRKRR